MCSAIVEDSGLSINMGTYIAILLLIGALPMSFRSCSAQNSYQELKAGFGRPPAAAKLRCYWWWLNGNTNEETITRDLTEMSRQGFGGALLVDANGSNQTGNDNVPPGPTFGGPEWTKLFLHALKKADELKLEISLNITSGWNLGGPAVRPEEASKILTWSRVIVKEGIVAADMVAEGKVKGGKSLSDPLPMPTATNAFFRPIAVLAYPLHHGASLAGSRGDARHPIRDLPFKIASRETGFSMPDPVPLLQDFPPALDEQDANLNEVLDLTAQIDSLGALHWQAPPGTWEVLRIGYTDSGAKVSTSSGAWQGLAIDYLDHNAFDSYWNRDVVPLLTAAKPYIGKSLKYLVSDSWELGGTNWTARFRDEFKKLRGYDPAPYLPVITGRIVQDRASSNRFLNDLRRTIGDLIVSEHYAVFAEHAHQYGLGTHPESGGPHGAPLDALETFRDAAFPQTEYWAMSKEHRTEDYERFFLKQAASAAHIYGKTLVAAEGMTSIGPQWSESLGMDLKPSFDQALTEGLNRLIWHEFTSSPVEFGLPGNEYFAGTHLNPNVTWWPQGAAFFAYLNRSQYMMQQGIPVNDLLYYYGDHVPNFVRLKRDDPAHVLPGYDYDVTDEDALLHNISMNNGALQGPLGLQYRALALPATGSISLEVLKRMEAYVRGGGSLIGFKPLHATGLAGAGIDGEIRRLADAMWGNCDGQAVTEHVYGRGTIYCIGNARTALTAMHITPDFDYKAFDLKSGDPDIRLDYIHRRVDQDDADIYFVRNPADHAIHAMATFRVADKQPELWDAVTGKMTPQLIYKGTSPSPASASSSSDNTASAKNTTSVPLSLDAYGSIFVVFAKPQRLHAISIEASGSSSKETAGSNQLALTEVDGRLRLQSEAPGRFVVHMSDGSQRIVEVSERHDGPALRRPWSITFQKDRGAPAETTMDSLTSWSESSDAGIRYFSGTAIYRTTFFISPRPMEYTGKLWLALSKVHEIATVRINGRTAGTLWAYPYRLPIDKLLRLGQNTLEIEVSNLWPNRIIGDLQPGATRRYTRTNIRKYTKDSPLLPSGLIGPVTIQLTYDVPVPSRN